MPDLKQHFQQVAIKMRADFGDARAMSTHSGLKGTALENTVKKFLRKYLPKRLGICSGQVVDQTGAISRQLDVIIYDAFRTPTLFVSEDNQTVPIECVYAVVEVKAHLDASSLDSIFTNMMSVKGLQKTSYYTETSPIISSHGLYGRQWDHWPTHYYVFGFEGPPDPRTTVCLRWIEQYNQTLADPHLRIDLMCLLDRGVFLNYTVDDGKFHPLPTPETIPIYLDTPHSLLLFYTLIFQILGQCQMPQFNFTNYMGRVDWNASKSSIG